MSSIFSDPPFRRGTTLASGDFGDAATSGPNILGGEVVGQIKAFQDVDPSSGLRRSNRLVYCQAVRWLGAESDGATIAGQVYAVDLALENGKPFCSVTSAASNANVAAGREYGVIDEYLTGTVKPNDVIWIVRKGPTSIKQNAATSIASGAQVQVSSTAGKIEVLSTGESLGINIGGAATAATADTLVRVSMIADDI